MNRENVSGGAEIIIEDDENLDGFLEVGRILIENIFEGKPLDELKALIVEQNAPLWYQDEPEGNSPLHAAAHVEDMQVIELLLENGAVWNAGMFLIEQAKGTIEAKNCNPVDRLGYTAADVALSLNNEECYRAIRDAGLRSGLFCNLTPSLKSV